MTQPAKIPPWRTWDTGDRDASTGFEIVYPRFNDRHKGQRWKDATRIDIDFDDSSPITNGNFITMLTSEIWIPPYADALVAGFYIAANPISTGPGTSLTAQVRFLIGGVADDGAAGDPQARVDYFTDPGGTPKGDDGGTDEAGGHEGGGDRVAFWRVPTSGGPYLDTVQTLLIQYSTMFNCTRIRVLNDPATPAPGNRGARPWRWEEVN